MDPKTEQENKGMHEPAIRAMEKRLQRNPDGTLSLNAKTAQELGVDATAFDNLQRSLEETNKKIQSGQIKPDQIRMYDDPPR